MYANLHLHPRAEPVQHRNQAVHREAPKVSVANAREVSRCDTRAGLRRAHGHPFPVKRLDDLGGQDGLELLRIRALVSKVPERIPAAPHRFQLLAFHRNSLSKSVQPQPRDPRNPRKILIQSKHACAVLQGDGRNQGVNRR